MQTADLDWVVTKLETHRSASDSTCILGITGAQGTGKTTLARDLVLELLNKGYKAVTFSIDDFYLTKEERESLKAKHPFLKYRGPYGTHDTGLMKKVLDELRAGKETTVPVFDKSRLGGVGDRLPSSQWQVIIEPQDIVIFEGWCVGGRPVRDADLAEPINDIEAELDARGEFRRFVNEELKEYQDIFTMLDALLVLYTNDLENVYKWRGEQEIKLRARTGDGMNEQQVREFVDYYIPLTLRYILPLSDSSDENIRAVNVDEYR